MSRSAASERLDTPAAAGDGIPARGRGGSYRGQHDCDGRRERRRPTAGTGRVILVGAGPGDPDLLTLRAIQRLGEADVVVFDHLVGREVLALIPAGTRRIYVGKRAGRHTMPQEHINQLLAELAGTGACVVRLKGGDPFVFGRGGEELEEMAAAGIDFEVVPGITAASGVAAYAGIPLTHRDHAQSCVLVTGHLKEGSLDLDWPSLARPRQTVVFYMGVGALEQICSNLRTHGLPAGHPAALVENGTLPNQRTIAGTLWNLPALARAAGVRPPALLIVGTVVSLGETIAWYERRATDCEAA
ncbi:MAG: uroporphyrinogen-III C-methyltransferase [Rhodocyclaceae bacterium]|nr:uroporphyrinogen-III C-methyltransferase [Rhodocyclaceae bacterium]